jgi:hypothetical protein
MNIELDEYEQKLKDDVLFLAGGDLALGLDLLVRCHAVSASSLVLKDPRCMGRPPPTPIDATQDEPRSRTPFAPYLLRSCVEQFAWFKTGFESHRFAIRLFVFTRSMWSTKQTGRAPCT